MEKKDDIKEEKGLALEMLGEMKGIIKKQWILIIILTILLAGTNVYHEYLWSQVETVLVDSKDGGNASYIGNDGDVNNYGESGSPKNEEQNQQTEKGKN